MVLSMRGRKLYLLVQGKVYVKATEVRRLLWLLQARTPLQSLLYMLYAKDKVVKDIYYLTC